MSAESFLSSAVAAIRHRDISRWAEEERLLLIVALQVPNVAVGASWPYLVGVFGILVNAFGFFWILLLGRAGSVGRESHEEQP